MEGAKVLAVDGGNQSRTAPEQYLPFERRILELEGLIANAQSETEREDLQKQLESERKATFSDLSAWQCVQLARHPLRPRMLDYTAKVFEDVVELHGDRALGDDPAMVGGIARFEGQTVVLVGQQKGVSTEEKIHRNFGMAHPEGYRKALRLFDLAERFHYPIVTLVDTPAAHPGVEAEQRGQGPAIATNLRALMGIKTPVFSAVLGEGGSGGALGVAVGDWVTMFEHSIYVICPPERCAEILWRDAERKELAASALKVTARDLLELGVIDAILPEPQGGAHRDPDAAANILKEAIAEFLAQWKKGVWTPERRQEKFRAMGQYRETACNASHRSA